MHLKLVRSFCVVICFIGIRSQRSWGPNGYNTGFSNSWTSNGFSNQNFGSWGLSEPNQLIFGSNQFNRRPLEQQFSYESPNKKTGWSSDIPKKSNTEVSQSAFNARQPDRKKLTSVINAANDNTNSLSNNDNLSSGNQFLGSNNQNSKANEWNSDNVNTNADTAQSNSFSAESYNNNFSSFGPGRPSGTISQNSDSNNQITNSFNNRPTSNEFSYWGSNKPSGQNSQNFKNNKPTGNDVSVGSDYEENSVYSWNANKEKNKPSKSKWENTTSKPSRSTSKPPSFGKWDQNENGKKQEADAQNDRKTNIDMSILDELDKNDWYFGKESNYPKPPFKSVLNIDVSELWNFDKNRKPYRNSKDRKSKGSNGSRKNRQSGEGEEGIHCECVSVGLCDEENMIVAQEDIQFGWGPLEAYRCERLTEVCCTDPKPRFSARANIEEKSEGTLDCGQRRIRKGPFAEAFAGNIGEPGEFPWNLQLQTSKNNCSASLIHPQLALTAAHCVTNVQPHELSLKAGLWSSDKKPPQHRKVSRIILHPAYSSHNPRNDIALLLMENGFELNDDVNTICLPFSNDKWESDRCLVAGWRPEEVNGETVPVLEKSAVDFIPQPECQNIMLITDLWRNYVLHDSFLCAREKPGNGVCLWSEGGAVMCPSQNKPDTYLQIGIVSNGMNCDNFGRPGIFTNVLKFLDWINKNHFDLGLNYDLDIRSQ